MLQEIIELARLNKRNDDSQIFLFPYYAFIKKEVKGIVPSSILYCKATMVESLTYQIVSYAYEHYFKYVYPYEFRLAKDNGLLLGATDEDKNRYFIDYLSAQEEWVNYCFEKYPHLLWMLESYSDRIIRHIQKLLVSIQNDYKQLIESFDLRDSLLEDIKVFEGDLHDGRCVSSVTFQNGVKLYYKPRNASNEKFLIDVRSYLEQIGLSVRVGIPHSLDFITYSWHLHINPQPIEGAEAITEYYKNLGKIQGLLYLLGTRDIIPDNIICVGDSPYFIDCEAITSKQFVHLDSTNISLYLQESVLQTGILPDWMFNDANDRSRVSSVLFEFGKKNLHLPHSEGQFFPIEEDSLKAFENGFVMACDFFREHKTELANFFKSYDSSSLLLRVLLHPTVIYSVIIEEMVTPPYLHGDKNIRELIDPLIKEDSYGKLRDKLITSTVAQIEKGNVPYFYIKTNNSSLFELPHASIVDNWISKDLNDLLPIEIRLSALTKKRQVEQLNIIDEALNFFIDVIHGGTKTKRILPMKTLTFNRKTLLRAIERLDCEIQKRMIMFENEIGFVCRTKNSYDGKFQVCQMNDSLYDGMLGVCLFYRVLFNYTHDSLHKNIADEIFTHLSDNWHKTYKGVKETQIPISPLSGFTGLLYLMERFPEYYDKELYGSVLDKTHNLIPITTLYDYMSGLTGFILLLSQCRLISEETKFSMLKECGERLIHLAERTDNKTYWTYVDGNKITGEQKMILGGFAHGSSSVSLALLLLYRRTKDVRYDILFRQTLKHDRSFYSEEIKGWVDGRDPLSKQDSGSWCHGAAGIALSRLALMSNGYEDAIMKTEFSIACPQIEKRIGYNLSVCHGSMGNLEVLHALTGNPAHCLKWVDAIAKEIISNQDVICGDNNRNSQVGLFMGFAGVGYQLLRFYDWERLPSIICIEIKPTIDSLHQKAAAEKLIE